MIKLTKIEKSFGKQLVLDSLGLEIKPGDRIALIGQNGAGKTTLIRTLLGQYTHQGLLSVFGVNPRQQRVDVLQKIGFVPQHSPPIQMSVKELIAFSDSLSAQSIIDKVRDLAAKLEFDVQQEGSKPFYKLSGGMKQKLLISLAMSRRPDFLIMDEPAANLDPPGRKAFFGELSCLPKQTAMLLSSHRVDELLPLVNRIIEMDCGRIVQDERTTDSVADGKLLNCQLQISNENEAIRKTLSSWRFSNGTEPGHYSGEVAEADRMRFFNDISHFSNHIQELNLEAS
ncbi:MAG: ABC transporter ATP-binding protein [SAR324 cluster bacterium]|nr:ABC transporter ATP-binding protein [SAR324 cluster bacterium]MBL7035669.1 ABC transporter ATP-binding protein [SAR324 cluster bacterium]